MRNENDKWQWEMRINLWMNKKKFFLISCQINV